MLKFDTNRVMNSEKNILDAKKALQNAKSSIDGIKIPNDFIYASSLKSISISIEDIDKEMDSLKNWIKDKADRFIRTKNLELYLTGFSTESELVPEWEEYAGGLAEGMDFANKYIDYEWYNSLRFRAHRTDSMIMSGILGREATDNFLMDENRKELNIEISPYVNKKMSDYLYKTYAIKCNESDITKVTWRKYGENYRGVSILLKDNIEISFDTNLQAWIKKKDFSKHLSIGSDWRILYDSYDSGMEGGSHFDVSEYYKKGIYNIPKVYKIEEGSKQFIRKKYLIKDDFDIVGGAFADINGKNTPVYWISNGDQNDNSISSFVNYTMIIDEQMKKYPSNAIDKVHKFGSFSAFLIGPHNATIPGSTDNNWAGFTMSTGSYIYIDEDEYDFVKNSLVIHEFTHALDATMGLSFPFLYFSDHDPKMSKLFKKYRITIQDIPELHCNGYCSNEMYPKGVPNKTEFFATLSELYITRPEDLKELLPECYEYMDEFYKNM